MNGQNGDIGYKQLAILLVVVMAGASGGNFLADTVNPPRPDPYTGSNAEADRRALEAYVTAQITRSEARIKEFMDIRLREIALENRELESRIRRDMPPPATRARIRAIERWIETKDPAFEIAADEWQ